VGLADALMTTLKKDLESLELVPGVGGRFEVFFDGAKVWSKLETKEFPDDMKIVQAAVKAGSRGSLRLA
jgi:selT/selW/selH-like putative selenoprotein